MAGYYDKNKDYSLAIKQAQQSGASQSVIDNLREERQNKIDAQYGGRDPYKGSSNIMGGGSRPSSSGSGSTIYRPSNPSAPNRPKYNYGGAYDPSKHDSIIDKMSQEAAKGDYANWDEIGRLSAGLITGTGDGVNTTGDGTLMNQVMNDLQKKHNYNANKYYGGLYDKIHGQGAWADPDFWGRPGQTVNPQYADAVAQSGSHGKPAGGMNGFGSGNGGFAGNPVKGTAEDYLRQLYAAKKEALEAQLQLAMKQGQSEIDARNEQLANRYEEQRNQLAAQRDIEQMRLGEMGLAQGLNTGAYGQLAAGQSSAYMDAMGGLMSQEQADRAESDRALQQIMNQYNNALAQGSAQIESDLYDALYQDYLRQQEAAEAARQEQIRQQQYMAELQAQQDAVARKEAEAKAKVLAGYGNFSGYAALGYTPQEIAAMQAGWNRLHPVKTSSRTSSGRRSKTSEEDYSGYYSEDTGKKSQVNSGGSDRVDFESLREAAGGPVSPKKAAEMEHKGEIVSFVEDGVLKFSKPTYWGQSDLLPAPKKFWR